MTSAGAAPPSPLPERPDSRKTVALLVGDLDDRYQAGVLFGVADAAADRDVNLLCLSGGALEAHEARERLRSEVYELARSAQIDGLLVMAGTVGSVVGSPGLAAFCGSFAPRPVVNVAWQVPGFPCVVVDNGPGVRDAVAHLIDDHGLRRIAFLRGPTTNDEAEARYDAYRRLLVARGLFDPELVVPCDFSRRAGAVATSELLGRLELPPEAIVACDDVMALGVLDEVQGRGLDVPDDIAVVGFDDVEETLFSVPPLTTVRQRLYEQGRLALDVALRAIDDLSGVPQVTRLETELVLRESCGCIRRATDRAIPTMAATGLQQVPSEEDLLGGLEAAVRSRAGAPDRRHLRELVGATLAELSDDAELSVWSLVPVRQRFLRASLRILHRCAQESLDIGIWQEVTDELRAWLVPHALGDPPRLARVEALLQELRFAVSTTIEQSQARQRLRYEHWARSISATGGALVTTFDGDALMDQLRSQFRLLGIDGFAVCLRVDEGLRLAAGVRGNVPMDRDLPVPSGHFAPPVVIPEARWTFLVEPLFFGEERLGHVLVELGPRQGFLYEALRDQLSAALKGMRLVRQIVETDEERQHLLDSLAQRARDLERANQALEDGQHKLLLAEKMASIGRLTANIAHEMNTPLAAVRSAIVEQETLLDEVRASTHDPEVTEEDHLEIAGELARARDLAHRATSRAYHFVRGIHTQSEDVDGATVVAFDPVGTVSEALTLLGYAVRQGGVELASKLEPGLPPLRGTPGKLAQVVTNLVTNSVDALRDRPTRRIEVSLRRVGDSVELMVADTGAGMPPEVQSRIFEPLFTTKPFGRGTGMGLAIVGDIVRGHFAGTIAVDSSPDEGTTFTVTLPTPGSQ